MDKFRLLMIRTLLTASPMVHTTTLLFNLTMLNFYFLAGNMYDTLQRVLARFVDGNVAHISGEQSVGLLQCP